MSAFAGVIPPVCTPLGRDGAVDVRSLEALVEHLLAAGVHGIFALGSSGESVYLSDDDRRTVLDVVVGAVAGAVPVLAGALGASPARVIEQMRWMRGHGCAAFVVTAPFYANVTPAETVRHFEIVAAAASLPVLAYDIPGNVGKKLATETSLELLTREVVVGLKDSSGQLEEFRRLLTGLPPRGNRSSSVLTGSDSCAIDALDAGADGIVPGIGNVCAPWFVQLWNAHEAGDRATAEHAQRLITAMTEVFTVGERYGLGRHASEIGGLKVALEHDGVITSSRVSMPMSAMPPEAVTEVIGVVERVRR